MFVGVFEVGTLFAVYLTDAPVSCPDIRRYGVAATSWTGQLAPVALEKSNWPLIL